MAAAAATSSAGPTGEEPASITTGRSSGEGGGQRRASTRAARWPGWAGGQEVEPGGDGHGEAGEGGGADVVGGGQPGGQPGTGRLGEAEGSGDVAHEIGDERATGAGVEQSEGGGDDGGATAALHGPAGDEHGNPRGAGARRATGYRGKVGCRLTGGCLAHNAVQVERIFLAATKAMPTMASRRMIFFTGGTVAAAPVRGPR